MIPSLHLVTGGCRSGKSSFAQSLAEKIAQERMYIATAEARDDSMATRIKKHQSCRDSSWKTLEIVPSHFSHFIQSKKDIVQQRFWSEKEHSLFSTSSGVLLFDCLTLFISGQMEYGLHETNLDSHLDILLHNLFSFHVPVIIVTNEVGLGGIASTSLGRTFCDMAGLANQYIAQHASSVTFVVSGIPMVIKGAIPT